MIPVVGVLQAVLRIVRGFFDDGLDEKSLSEYVHETMKARKLSLLTVPFPWFQ